MDRIRAAILQDSNARSPLYKWLRRNHQQFSDTLAEAGRPDWAVIARAFGAEGLTDGDGKAPSKEGARQTWYKVKKDVASSAARVREAKVSPVRIDLPPPPRTQESISEGQEAPDSGISGLFDKADAEQRPWMPRKRPKKE
jgi:hypothetical protein